ncbi:MAG TPA: hypothetical protein PKE55_08695 [Kiritimatiellia bacterium]|nr:hypothetical protein [Kiritimatiellia bacterium]
MDPSSFPSSHPWDGLAIRCGALEYYGSRYPYHPVAFDIAKGKAKSIAVTRVGRIAETVHFDARLSEDGNTFYWDDFGNDRFVMVSRDWSKGQIAISPTPISGSGIRLSGATFDLKFKDFQGAPRRVIIEHR